ncbi:MAG: hypothetical protein ACTSQO_15115 [Candidatus Helarchaeota archaeon]
MENEQKGPLKINIFWSIIIFASFNIIVGMGFLFGLIINFYTFLMVLIILNIVAIILSVLGIHKEQKLKKEIRSDTKWAIFFRKLFNIAGGLATLGICWFLGPWLTFFVMVALLFAFGLHEILYVKYKIKTLFTNTILAFGRDSGPDEIFWPSINALSSFSFVIGVCSIFFSAYFGTNFWWQLFIVAAASILIWGVGDSTAYYMGTAFGKKKLPWNENKSYIGSLSFLIVGTIIALIFLSPYIDTFFGIQPLLSGYNWIWISASTGLLGAFVESLNIKITDNFTVPAIISLFLALAIIVF